MSRELIWPPSLRITSMERRLIGNAGVSRSPLSGATTTVDRSGDRWAISVTVENMSDRASYAERASAEAFTAAIRNRNARVWIHDPSYAQRGSFSAPELFANADFANGTTGWSTQNSTLSVRDRVMRVAVSRASTGGPSCYQSPAVTQYRPLVVRGFHGARSRNGALIGVYANGSTNYAVDRSGLQAVAWTPASASADSTHPVVYDADLNVSIAGDWIETPFASLAHCALVDNGPNALLYSDQLDNAVWNKLRTSITANAAVAPDGTSTADAIVEDTSVSTSHIITQGASRVSVAEDLCAYGYFKRGSGTRDIQMFIVADGSSNGFCSFNLGAGTAGTSGVNGSATNVRTFIRDAGNGWYYCAVVARCPATTSLNTEIDLLNAGSSGYTGNGTSSVYAWRCGAARSSVPTRGALTIATALASGTSQTGSGLYLKGLPASTSGLLLAGDAVQIGKQFFKVLAPLDSDAAGLGYLEVSPNIRTPFADNDPVIINQPMGRYMLASDDAGYSTRAGRISTMTLEFEEALD